MYVYTLGFMLSA